MNMLARQHIDLIPGSNVPVGATHFKLTGAGFTYYRADCTPHQQWNGFAWFELGKYSDVTKGTQRLGQLPEVTKTHDRNYFVPSYAGDIYHPNKYKGD